MSSVRTVKPSAFHIQDENLFILYSKGGFQSHGTLESYIWINTWSDIILDFQSNNGFDRTEWINSLLFKMKYRMVMDGSEKYDADNYCLDKPTDMIISTFDAETNSIDISIANATNYGVGNIKVFTFSLN